MSSAREQQIRALVRAALERPPGERASFVAELAGADEDLRRSVDAQLSQQNVTDVGTREPTPADAAVELPSGAQLGHYRIDGVLGRGGMGVVYRATDTRLGRPVAIKFLSAAVTDAEVSRRFRQEAKTASSLNHPHIVTVHDVGEHDGRQYIVSELVDGGTLDDWTLTAKRRTWRQSVELLIGVADALAAAHSAGVLHRDVKPGNILIGSNGYAKLADFGLAKLVDSGASSALRSGSKPRQTTRAGVVVGTVAYMSPEQAAGHAVDARSDVFSFGIVLYELLAGRRPFEAANDLEVLKAIAHASPKPLPDDVPEFLRHVVDKALEKEPADRYQSMQDLVVDLKRVARKAASSQSAMSASDVRVVAGVVKRHPGLVTGVAAALVLAIVGTTYVALSGLAPPRRPPASAATLGAYEIAQLTTSGNAVMPAISPDGKYVAYTQRQETVGGPTLSLWIRQIATTSNALVVPAEPGIGVFGPTVTPDGTFVDFLHGDFQRSAPALWRAPFIGGRPKPFVENVWGLVGWSPDGRQMAFIRADPAEASSALVVADADGGRERVLARREAPVHFLSLFIISQPLIRPAWSPDGRSIAVFESDSRTLASRVVVVDAATGNATPLGPEAGVDAQGLAWLGPDALVLSQSAGVAQRVQLWRLSYPDGALSRLTNDLNSYIGVDVDAARTSLVTSRRDARASLWVGDAAGVEGAEIVRPVPFGAPLGRVLWAGARVLYDSEVNGQYSIAEISPDAAASEERVPNGFAPSATSTGDTIVFMNTSSGAENGIWKLSAPSRQPVPFVRGDAFMPIVTPDDRNVVFLSTRGGRQSPWIVPIEGGEPTQISDVQAGADSLRVSPDGRRLLFMSLGQAARLGLTVCDLPSCTNRRDFSLPPNGFPFAPRWTADGEIAYLDVLRTNIWSLPLAGGAPHQLTRFRDDVPNRAIVDYAWSRDGQRLAVLRVATTNDIALLRLKP